MINWLYTIVCRYYTQDGIFDIDLYDDFKRMNVRPYTTRAMNIAWDFETLVDKHVYAGDAVLYLIKKVDNEIVLNKETAQLYSRYSPYSLMYTCLFGLKDVSQMNQRSIYVRSKMTDAIFNKIYGGVE